MQLQVKKIIRVAGFLLCFFFLTVLTQIGGLVLAVALFLKKYLRRRFQFAKGLTSLTGLFIILYLLFTLVIVPIMAPLFGRVPLSMGGNLKPLNLATCLLNRHYVVPELKQLAIETANQMAASHPRSELRYLDANFPFVNGFPLFPHISHNDGKKLDLALYFKKGKLLIHHAASKIGYGGCVEPEKGEINKPEECHEKGYWQYNLLHKLLPGFMLNDVDFDEKRTKKLVEILLEQPQLEKLFLEPHLINRLNINHPKARYHGCHAVRHDDHIHIQIK